MVLWISMQEDNIVLKYADREIRGIKSKYCYRWTNA